jgi:CRP-like cAMP-binding protein
MAFNDITIGSEYRGSVVTRLKEKTTDQGQHICVRKDFTLANGMVMFEEEIQKKEEFMTPKEQAERKEDESRRLLKEKATEIAIGNEYGGSTIKKIKEKRTEQGQYVRIRKEITLTSGVIMIAEEIIHKEEVVTAEEEAKRNEDEARRLEKEKAEEEIIREPMRRASMTNSKPASNRHVKRSDSKKKMSKKNSPLKPKRKLLEDKVKAATEAIEDVEMPTRGLDDSLDSLRFDGGESNASFLSDAGYHTSSLKQDGGRPDGGSLSSLKNDEESPNSLKSDSGSQSSLKRDGGSHSYEDEESLDEILEEDDSGARSPLKMSDKSKDLSKSLSALRHKEAECERPPLTKSISLLPSKDEECERPPLTKSFSAAPVRETKSFSASPTKEEESRKPPLSRTRSNDNGSSKFSDTMGKWGERTKKAGNAPPFVIPKSPNGKSPIPKSPVKARFKVNIHEEAANEVLKSPVRARSGQGTVEAKAADRLQAEVEKATEEARKEAEELARVQAEKASKAAEERERNLEEEKADLEAETEQARLDELLARLADGAKNAKQVGKLALGVENTPKQVGKLKVKKARKAIEEKDEALSKERERKQTEEKARLEAEEKLKIEEEKEAEKARVAAERAEAEAESKDAEERERKQMEEKARLEAEEKLKIETEKEAEKARVAAERAQAEAESKDAEERERKQMEEKARLEAEEKLKIEEEKEAEKARVAAERAQAEAESKDAEERERKQMEEKARLEAEEKVKLEEEKEAEKARVAAERSQAEAEIKDAEERERKQLEEKARLGAEKRLKLEEEKEAEKARVVAEKSVGVKAKEKEQQKAERVVTGFSSALGIWSAREGKSGKVIPFSVKKAKAPMPRNPAKLQNVIGDKLDASPSFVPPIFEKTKKEKKFIRKSIETFSMFEDLPETELEPILDAFERVEYKEGETIADQGDSEAFFYIVQNGEVSFHANGDDVGKGKKGDAFGALALVHPSVRGSSVKANNQTVLFRVESTNYRRIKQHNAMHSVDERIKLLHDVPFFKNVSDSDLKQLSAAMVRHEFKAGDDLAKAFAGVPFCLVQTGKVFAADVRGSQTAAQHQGLVGPGGSFGEESLVSQKPKQTNITAFSSGVAFTIDHESFEKVFGDIGRLKDICDDKKTLVSTMHVWNILYNSKCLEMLTMFPSTTSRGSTPSEPSKIAIFQTLTWTPWYVNFRIKPSRPVGMCSRRTL